ALAKPLLAHPAPKGARWMRAGGLSQGPRRATRRSVGEKGSGESRRAMILDQILEHKRAELRHKQSRGYLSDLKVRIRDVGPTLGFAVTLDATRTPSKPALIAEVKKASPSLGFLRPEFE